MYLSRVRLKLSTYIRKYFLMLRYIKISRVFGGGSHYFYFDSRVT